MLLTSKLVRRLKGIAHSAEVRGGEQWRCEKIRFLDIIKQVHVFIILCLLFSFSPRVEETAQLVFRLLCL